MSSSKPENQDNVDQPNGNGSNADRETTSPDVEQGSGHILKRNPQKPSDLKSICYRLLQKIDRTSNPDSGMLLPESDSPADTPNPDRSMSAQNFTGLEHRGGLPASEASKGISSKGPADCINENNPKETDSKEKERPILDLGSFDEPLAVSMESFFEFNFEISESLDDLVAEFELKKRMQHWNEWGVDDSNDREGEFVFNERDLNDPSLPNPITAKFPK